MHPYIFTEEFIQQFYLVSDRNKKYAGLEQLHDAEKTRSSNEKQGLLNFFKYLYFIQLSFLIRNENERLHRGGINALRYDAKSDRLYTAGRDSIIRAWDCKRYGV